MEGLLALSLVNEGGFLHFDEDVEQGCDDKDCRDEFCEDGCGIDDVSVKSGIFARGILMLWLLVGFVGSLVGGGK